ncbi:MAG: flagellar biosynthesis protein FlhA [Alphaproteobacteria bacterium 64-11]|nr:flagellar biosynthesis protein FlhA [Alphaproteobacteria bacterium]OJU09002.1 MAG: flagellar biosynthesis protein FlhA [Alphaproteobacteria bacterium 64-11]
MTDITNTAPAPSGLDFSPGKVIQFIRKSDLGLAIGIMAILMVLIVPLPTWLLDVSLAFSLSFSILILMTAVFVRKPLEFSSFPTILLITTMLRLALNLASTRLILGHGNEGTAASGYVIQAFGKLVMQGNFVIGLIVFIILIIVNFVVITKGSGRIAEVAARFSLDAMPGKQMAIDADLSAGLIDEKEAKLRRKTIEAESNFFGAMDGASKFVRGDAIAGLLITGINIVGGIIIGVVQHGVSFADASQTYTLLTVGDGLVSQMPALIVSTAAGLMVSKAGVEGATDKALMGQLSFYPQALGMAAAVMGIVAVLPGMPTLVFAGLSGATGTLAWVAGKRKDKRVAEAAAVTAAADGPPKEEPISTALALDLLRVELGYGLLPLINDVQGHRITDQIKALRRQLAQEMGFVMPAVRILDNMQLGANEYRIRIKEFDSGKGELFPGSFLVMDPRGLPIDLPGTHTTEPAFGLPATWVSGALKEEAAFRGFTVVDPGTVLTTHLTEVLKSHMAELLSYAETKKLLDDLPPENRKLVEEIIPAQISVTGVQRVLQTLLSERVSIRDLPAILEGIAEAVGHTKNALYITEHVRARLSRQLCNANLSHNGYLPLIALSPAWEQAFAESIVGQGEDRQLAMAPSQLQQFITQVREAFDDAGAKNEVPVLLTSPQIRPFVRSIIERFRPQTVVMSQNEIHASVRLRTLGQV